MREIKFEYGFESVNGIVKKKYYLHEIPFLREKCDVWNVLPVVYMRQYTGLKDKNGVEIYEGDITKDKYVIMFHKDKALFAEHFHSTFKNVWNLSSYPISSQGIEIIGNIHENLNLLNQPEQKH